jgi:hypothetical protein
MANSKRKCKHCDTFVRVDVESVRNGVVVTPSGAFCDAGHAFQWAQDNADRMRRKTHRAEKAAFKAKDTVTLKKSAQAAVNRLCKLLDQGKSCISCGKPDQGGRLRNASHFKSRGANSALRFDLWNLHQSCQQCNQYLSGNLVGYREGLLERYGQWILDYLESAPRLKEWTADELKTIRAEAAAECKRIESGQPPSRNWREWERAA